MALPREGTDLAEFLHFQCTFFFNGDLFNTAISNIFFSYKKTLEEQFATQVVKQSPIRRGMLKMAKIDRKVTYLLQYRLLFRMDKPQVESHGDLCGQLWCIHVHLKSLSQTDSVL